MMKKLYIVVGVLLIAALAIGSFGCAKPAPTPAPGVKPIKIGVLHDFSGVSVEAGRAALRGIKLAFDEVNWEVAGRPIELIVEADEFDVGISIAKLRKMMLSDKIDLLLGPNPTVNIDISVMPIYEDRMIVRLFTWANSFPPPQYETKYRFRTNYPSGFCERIQAYVAYKDKGYRKVVAFTFDFDAGQQAMEVFKQVFEGLGGEVIQEVFTPIGTLDYAPYLLKIDVENADAVLLLLNFGADSIRFMKQYAEYGLRERLPIFVYGNATTSVVLPDIGDAALGVESVYQYADILDTPENNRLKKLVWDKYGKEGSYVEDWGYIPAKLAIYAIEAVNGNMEDVDGQVEALEKGEWVFPRGPYKFATGLTPAKYNHFAIMNIYHLRVDKVNGRLQNTVLETYPMIPPGWLPAELR